MVDYRKQMKEWLESNRPFSTAEVQSAGISRQTLVVLQRQGVIDRLCRGVYLASNANITENLSLQIAALKVPSGVVCLLSALRFHKFTTQLPQEIWLAVKQQSRKPCMGSIELRVIAMGQETFHFGIEEHDVDGIKIRVYSAAKTVADCFKFRNKIGTDVAFEALREGYRLKLFSVSELMNAAKICRVSRIITPYMESLFP
ncbi:MAG: type IV toxin-antitoxin system AbiEi family antitoxin domain-containing protein [Lentisphaeria bacterium]